MSRSGFTLWAALLSVPLGCGARTTLDQDDYLEGGAISRGGTTGGSTAGGQGAVSAAGGSAGVVRGGSDPGGMTGVGGTVSVGGKGGSISMGGKGGGPTDEIRVACDTFCGPFSAACPAEAGTPSECATTCMSEFGDGRGRCREITVQALDCLTLNFNPGLPCNDALVNAWNACSELVQAADECNNSGSCSGSLVTSEVDCSATLMCPDGYYDAYCYRLDQTQTECNCISDSAPSTAFISDVPIQGACDYALELCGYPGL